MTVTNTIKGVIKTTEKDYIAAHQQEEAMTRDETREETRERTFEEVNSKLSKFVNVGKLMD